MASNFLFDPTTTRSIHVDSRYMLWNMAEVDGAIRLLQEMSIPEFMPGAFCAAGVSGQGGWSSLNNSSRRARAARVP
jgi:hypothetical protein